MEKTGLNALKNKFYEISKNILTLVGYKKLFRDNYKGIWKLMIVANINYLNEETIMRKSN